jgi:hemoglobin/transferrin/lactoferrin receptor protein
MNIPLTASITTLLTIVTAIAQQAPNTDTTTQLDEVIVTATRSTQSVFETPFTAHVVGDERFIGERNVRSLADALSETPGVLVQKTGHGQASPFIRGLTGFRTLLLIDGIRLNNAVFREGPNQYFATIDHLTIDRLDVVKGPSSVLYGSDAIGGTVNAITRSPEMLEWPEAPSFSKDGKKAVAPFHHQRFAFRPGAYYRYASAEDSHIARGEFSLSASPQVGIFGGVTWKSFDDLDGGDLIGTQPNTAYDEIDGDVKVLIRQNENVDIIGAFYRVEQNNVPRTHSTIFAKSFDNTAVGTDLRRDFDQRRELAYLQAEVREVAPWLDRVRLSLSLHRQSEEQDRIRDTGVRELSDFRDDQYGALVHFVSPSPIGIWSYGVEYYHDEVQSGGRDYSPTGALTVIRPRGPVADDASYELLGIYAQNVFHPVRALEVTLGGRYSWAHAEASGDKVDPNPNDALPFENLDESFGAFTASLRVRLDAARNWNFFGGVSEGFRAPNLSDFTSFELARSGERETPAYDLDPEYFTSFEIGTKARSETLRASIYAAYFYTLIDDQIVRFPTGATIDGAPEISRANAGEGYIQGIELGAEWNFWRGFSLFGNLSWTEGEADTFLAPGQISREPATRIQPLTGLLGLRWESEDRKWFVEGTAQLARHQDRLAPNDITDTQRIPPGGTRGYQVFSLRGYYKPVERVRIFAALENISDEDYRYVGSGANEAGTNFVVGSQMRF